MDTSNLKPCPFCGSTKLDISEKRAQHFDTVNYRTCVYCRTCKSYGPRVLVSASEVENNHDWAALHKLQEQGQLKAIEYWNKRSE